MPLNYNFDYEIKFAYYNLPTLKFLLVLCLLVQRKWHKKESIFCLVKRSRHSLVSAFWVSLEFLQKYVLEKRCVCASILFCCCCFYCVVTFPCLMLQKISHSFSVYSQNVIVYIVHTQHMCVCNFKWVNDNLWDMCIIHILFCVSAFVLLHNLVLTEIAICLYVTRWVTDEFVRVHPEQKKRYKRNRIIELRTSVHLNYYFTSASIYILSSFSVFAVQSKSLSLRQKNI